jgi:hypothetical protein
MQSLSVEGIESLGTDHDVLILYYWVPVVRPLAQKHGLHYHMTDFWWGRGTWSLGSGEMRGGGGWPCGGFHNAYGIIIIIIIVVVIITRLGRPPTPRLFLFPRRSANVEMMVSLKRIAQEADRLAWADNCHLYG